MTRSKWTGVFWVALCAILVVAVTVYVLYFGVLKDKRVEKTDDKFDHRNSAANEEIKPIPGIQNPNNKLTEPPPASREEALGSLNSLLTAVNANVYWNDKFGPVSYNLMEPHHADVYLKWLYYEELSRLQAAAGIDKATRSKVVDEITGFKEFITKNHPERHGYFQAYTQWYELICYCHVSREQIWAEGETALSLFNEVVRATQTPGSGRSHFDGSTTSALMYGTITLYHYSDRPNNSHRVGTLLGVYPSENNPVPIEERAMVKLLKRGTGYIESCYPRGVSTDLGLRYGPNGAETFNLVGGKILYFCSKAMLARQNGNGVEERQHLENARLIITGLNTTGKLPPTPYGYSYVLRGTAALIRMYAVRKEWDRVRELATFAEKFLKSNQPPVSASLSSEYYLPLIYLQFRNETENIIANALDVRGAGQ